MTYRTYWELLMDQERARQATEIRKISQELNEAYKALEMKKAERRAIEETTGMDRSL